MPLWIFRRAGLGGHFVGRGINRFCRCVRGRKKAWEGGLWMYDMRRIEARRLEKCNIKLWEPALPSERYLVISSQDHALLLGLQMLENFEAIFWHN